MYNQFNSILASDFDSFTGTINDTTANKLNSFWGVGYGDAGYGQTQVTPVGAGNKVNASDWQYLFQYLTSTGLQQNTSTTSIPSVSTGSRINYISTLSTDLTNCYNNRLNANLQGTTSTTTGTRSSSWYQAITVTHTITFESGDKARYFFNAGGQISLNFTLSGGTTPIYTLFQNLANACGTIYLSSPSGSNTATIVGTTYTGTTKLGGSGSPNTLATGTGYYDLLTTDTILFKQFATGLTPSGYVNSYIQVAAKTNGAQGSNGDKGSVITITTTFDEVPDNLTVNGTTSVNCVIRPPSATNITNTWGTISVTATTAGT